MNISDVIVVFKKARELNINEGLIMKQGNQSVALIKREDKKGIFYSINDRIDNIPQEPYNDDDLMLLLLVNKKRFKHTVYNTNVIKFE